MVIADADCGWAKFVPDEHDAPLVVDPDRVASRKVSPQGFQTVSRWDGKILENLYPVHLDEFAQGDASDRVVASVGLAMEKLLGVFV